MSCGAGDELELRGPIGGYFVWEESLGGPLLLVARRLRRRAAPRDAAPPRARPGATSRVRLLYSARTLDDVIYRDELTARLRRRVDVRSR